MLSAQLLQYAPYKAVHSTIKKELEAKGERAPDKDPQDNTGEDTLTEDQLILIFTELLKSSSVESCRDQAMCAWMTGTMGRSDDARLMYLADLLKPQLVKRLGEQTVSIVARYCSLV